MVTRRTFLGYTALASAMYGSGLPAARAAAAPTSGAWEIAVDWHSHYVSQAEINFFRQRGQAPRLIKNSDGLEQLHNVDTVSSAAGQPRETSVSDIEARLQNLDRNGIHKQLLTQTVPLGLDASIPLAELRPLFRAYNDELATVVARHPQRFLGVAALPSGDPAWAAEELRRAHRDLGLIGASLPLNAFSTLASAQALTPVFQVAQQFASHLFIHRGPASPLLPDQPALIIPQDTGFARWNLINNSHLTGAVITLGLTDFLAPYPDVSVELIMLGGFAPYLIDTWVQSGQANGIKDPLEKLRRLYIDTGPYSRNAEWTALAVRKFGADRILFGTDYGVGGGSRGDTAPNVQTVRQALSADELSKVFRDNSLALLKAKGLAV